MEAAFQLALQFSALGLLGYLIFWTTRDGAPKLFALLAGIQVAIEANSNRLEQLEEAVGELKTQVTALQQRGHKA